MIDAFHLWLMAWGAVTTFLALRLANPGQVPSPVLTLFWFVILPVFIVRGFVTGLLEGLRTK